MTAFRETENAADEQLLALEQRARELEQQLLQVQVAEREAIQLGPRLTSAVQEKAGKKPRRALRVINLDAVRVATPCHEDWNKMAGGARVRFCETCEKHVYNISGMPRELAERFLAEQVGDVCVRLYRREDGTLVNGDCPEGLRLQRLKTRFGHLLVAPAGVLVFYMIWSMFGRSVSSRINESVSGGMMLDAPCNLPPQTR